MDFIVREGKVIHCMQLSSLYSKSSNQLARKSISRDSVDWLMNLSWKPTLTRISREDLRKAKLSFWLPNTSWLVTPTANTDGQKRPTPYHRSGPFAALQEGRRGHSLHASGQRNKTWAMGCAHYALPLLGWKDRVSRYCTKTKSPAH